MPGAIVAVLLCVWYYQTATKIGINPLPWIVGALIVYYGVKYGWTYGVLKPLFSKTLLPVYVKDISGAIVGAIAVAIFRSKVMLKQLPPG